MEINPLTYGSVQYFPREGTETQPNFFEVAFMIGYTQDPEGISVGRAFEFAVGVPVEGPEQSYKSVEDAAARLLPQMLRDLADAVEKDLVELDRERAQKAAKQS